MIFTHNFFNSWLMFLIDVYQAKYYAEEVKDKSKKDIDVSNWEREFVEDLPEQQNGCVFFFLKYSSFGIKCKIFSLLSVIKKKWFLF